MKLWRRLQQLAGTEVADSIRPKPCKLSDLEGFEESLRQAKQLADSASDELWAEVAQIEAASEQQSVTVLQLLDALRLRMSLRNTSGLIPKSGPSTEKKPR